MRSIVRFPGRKTLVLAAALLLLLSSTIGGTVAWLADGTGPVVNTFTRGDIRVSLSESDADADGSGLRNRYVMMPGAVISKDPKVTVEGGSGDSWLFVEMRESENLKDFLEYEPADGWTQLAGQPGVYWRRADAGASAQTFDVLKGNCVRVRADVTREMLTALDAAGEQAMPTLAFRACAVQRNEDIEAISTAERAWLLAREG